jgi:hypothetical protein
MSKDAKNMVGLRSTPLSRREYFLKHTSSTSVAVFVVHYVGAER